MNRRARTGGVPLALLIWAWIAVTNGWTGVPTGVNAQGPSAASTPHSVLYQGYVAVSGEPFDGVGYFKFAVVDENQTAVYWSNDGTLGVPTTPVPVEVLDGYFTVLLGDTSLSGMRQPLTPEVFQAAGRYLKVWFSASLSGPFNALSPVPIAAAPYALNAATLGGAYPSAFQRRVLKVCAAGSSIRLIDADGSVSCEADDDTTYTPGNQLQMAGTTLHVTEGAGSGLDADLLDGQQGSDYRNADQVDGLHANQIASTAAYAGGDQSVDLSPAGTIVRYVTVNALRSGRVIVNASGYGYLPAETDSLRCSITAGTTIDTSALTIARGASYAPFAMTRGYTVGTGTYRFNLVCDANTDLVDVRDTNLTAIYVPGSFGALAAPDTSPTAAPVPDGCVDEHEAGCGP
jgi:hypothetical protein